MEKIKKLFGGINLTWTKVIIFAIIAGVYTAIMAILPSAKNTSFADITISFEVWVLFGIIIIMNSKSAVDSALKCFVFFLISQPLVYLIQVPFNAYGWGIFAYYQYWFMWTLLTIPMGFIGYYMKKDKLWGLIILIPMLIFVGLHYQGFLKEAIMAFPSHLLSTIFCLLTIIIYPLCIFNDKKIKKIGVTISALIILIFTIFAVGGEKDFYNTTILVSGGSEGIIFDDNYKAYLKDESFGKLYIVYENNIEDYMVNAEFKKPGKTEVVIESPSGEKIVYNITIEKNTYKIEKNSEK